jgi:phytoene desaturase
MTRAVIIGGGIGGLATAALLAAEGYEVTLVEASDVVGGRAGSWEQDGFRFDTGPSWYLMPEVFEHFFALLGTTAAAELDLVPLTPAYRVFGPDGDPLDIVSGRDAAASLFDAVEPGAGPALEAYLDSAGDAYDLAVSRFLYDPYTTLAGLRDPALLRRLPQLLPLLTTSLANHVERRFADSRLRQVLEYPAVFLGGSPYGVPSLYHLMSHLDLDEGVLYPRGGFTEIIAAIARLAAARGVSIRTSAEVEEIIVHGGAARGVRLASGEAIDADLVVSTADLHHTETALLREPAHRTYPESWWRKRTPSPGALLVLLGVRGELPQLAHHSLLFADEWRSSFEDIFGDHPRIPEPALRLPAECDRRHRRPGRA